MSLQQIPGLYYGPSQVQGRGVFCARDIAAGSTIEIAPVVPLPDMDPVDLEATSFFSYYFMWGVTEEVPALVLGFGTLYNHSNDPNADTIQDLEAVSVVFTAIRDIPAGEEIRIDYRQGMPDGKLWFEVVD